MFSNAGPPNNGPSNTAGALMLAGFAIALFGISAIALSQLLPGPHTIRDYFLIGCLSTLVSLFALFVILIRTWAKAPNPFFKRRKK